MFRHQSWIELHYWIIWNLNASMSPIGYIWTERMRKEIVLLGGLFVQSIIHDFRTGFYCIIVLKDNFFQMIGFFLSTHHSSSIHDITSQKAVGFFASWDLIMAQLFLIFLGHLNCTFFAHHFMDFLWSIWPPSFGQKWNSFWALCNGFSSFSSQLFVDSLVSSHTFVRAPFCKQRNF